MTCYEVIDTATGTPVFAHDDKTWAESVALGLNREQIERDRFVVTQTYRLPEGR